MTNETTPDAVEMLQRMHACVVLSENHGDVPRVSSDEVLAALRAVQAERARHAEEVARLEAVHLSALETIEAWKLASGLECGGDPDGVTPAGMRRYWEGVEADRDSLRDQLHQATELVSVLEERLDAFEDTEPDARACAEWVIDITQYGDTRQAARRYLSGVANRTATRLHRDVETLRDQLRRTESARGVATRVAADHFGTICQLRDQLRKVEGEREEALRMVDGLHKSEKTARESMVINMRLRDEAQAENVRLKAERDALRALLPDVRACAEYCRNMIGPPPGIPVEDYPLPPVALAARRILAALDSQGGEGE